MEERAKSTTSENIQVNREDTKSKISEIMLKLSQNEKKSEDNSAVSRALDIIDEGNVEEGLKILKEAAEQGDAEAQVNLAYVSYSMDENFDKALFWAKKAAEGGNIQAQEIYGFALCCSEKDHEKEEGFRYLERAANAGSISAMITYAEVASEVNAGKVILSKAISYCSEVEQKSNDSYAKDLSSRLKGVLKGKLKGVKSREAGRIGCLVFVVGSIFFFIFISIVSSAIAAIKSPETEKESNESKYSTEETVSKLGTEIIELHDLKPIKEKNLTVSAEKGYVANNSIWDGAFLYYVGSSSAYSIYQIDGLYEKITLEATPYKAAGHFCESSTADIMIVNSETNEILYTESIDYNSEVITIEVDITGVNQLGIYVNQTGNFAADTFIRNAYIYPVGMGE